jgi:putative SOS response-associated peptidase YedK
LLRKEKHLLVSHARRPARKSPKTGQRRSLRAIAAELAAHGHLGREPFKTRRCLVPASSWYEWQKISAKAKPPYHFKPKAEPFALAGVYDVWQGDGGMTYSALYKRGRG